MTDRQLPENHDYSTVATNLIGIITLNSLFSYFQQHKHAFLSMPYPDFTLRQQRLQRLTKALKNHSAALCQAITTDFGKRSIDETHLLEIVPCLQGLKYQLRHLKRWMRPQKRKVHYTFAPATNLVLAQPLGVVGIIVPWNYPIFLALGPLMAAISAGNQAMLKLSEFTPATNHVLTLLCQEALADCVTVVTGDAAIAAEFSALPFDHLLFTGSTAVGRKVMQAAAENLTPVTLELGGKSPVLIAPDANLSQVTKRILFGKTANAGQTCVAPDYILVPKTQQETLVKQLQHDFKQFYPNFPDTTDYSAIINENHYLRLVQLVQQAKAAGATVISCASDQQAATTRVMPLTLLMNIPADCALLQEEIFGPVLPIITYNTIEEAILYIQQRPKPLALYLMSQDKAVIEHVMTKTQSGGVCINDTLLHVAQDDLPFGGIGPSGMGNYHGPEGFIRFSHAKAIHQKGRFSSSSFIYPPFNRPLFRTLLRWLGR